MFIGCIIALSPESPGKDAGGYLVWLVLKHAFTKIVLIDNVVEV